MGEYEYEVALEYRMLVTVEANSEEEAHEKASEVERRFRDRFGAESHIIVHMEPKK